MRDLFLYVLMTLSAYRLTRLIVRDTFPPVLWIRDRLAGGWRPLTLKEHEAYNMATARDKARMRTDWSYDPDDEIHQRHVRRKSWSPHWLAELLSCPWCASAYVSGGVVLATDLTVGVPYPFLAGLATWAGASLIVSRESA